MKTITLDKPLNLGRRQNGHQLDTTNGGEITFYMNFGAFKKALNIAAKFAINKAKHKCVDCQGPFTVTTSDEHGKELIQRFEGRIHAVQCCDGALFSITVRSKALPKIILSDWDPDWEPVEKPAAAKPVNIDDPYEGIDIPYRVTYGALTEGQERQTDPPASPSNPAKIRPILRKGLILIAGETGSGKTTALNQILTQHLRARLAGGDSPESRLPHVVAIGDPVETLFFRGALLKATAEGLMKLSKRPIDFTARVIGSDVEDVRQALLDALRETPEAVIVSELRTNGDFAAALNFAATGHLIMATCHTGSLVETFAKLTAIHGPKNSASDRAALVSRLAAVIHIRRFKKYRVPALWRPTSRGLQDFISEGLASIIQASPPDGESGDHGVLGRYWMLNRIDKDDPELSKALGMDLKGE